MKRSTSSPASAILLFAVLAGSATAGSASGTQPVEPTQHGWLTGRVALLHDRAGVSEDASAKALLAHGGIGALIDAALASGSGAVHARYFVTALAAPGADSARIARLFDAGLPDHAGGRRAVLGAAARWMSSQANVPDDIFVAHLRAALALDGVHRRRALAEVLAVPTLSGRQLARAIRITEGVVGRSADRADMLIAAADGRTLDAVARAAYIRAAASIPSRGHRERALRAIRDGGGQSIGFRFRTIASRRDSRNGGSTTFCPSVSASSSTAKPGPSVAISNSTPFGSRT
jgi:hypothetical protein